MTIVIPPRFLGNGKTERVRPFLDFVAKLTLPAVSSGKAEAIPHVGGPL